MTYNKILNETNEKKNLNLFNQAYQYLKNNDETQFFNKIIFNNIFIIYFVFFYNNIFYLFNL